MFFLFAYIYRDFQVITHKLYYKKGMKKSEIFKGLHFNVQCSMHNKIPMKKTCMNGMLS